MGTNYYMATEPQCPTCGHKKPDRHIGKSSAGWVFSLHVYPDEGIHDLPDWLELFESSPEISDEYGKRVSVAEMIEMITERKWPERPKDFDYFNNCAEKGPKNLVRARKGSRGVTHGAGTWDCHTGDFS